MSNRQKFQSETLQEYKSEERRIFGLHGDSKLRKPFVSAADAAIADRHLPSKEQEYRMLERWEKGLTKASRSGAFSKASTGFAIRPSGLKFASEFVDSCTPGQYKPQQERPVPREQTRKVDVPPAAVTLTHLCIDCLDPVDQNDASSIIPCMFIIRSMNQSQLFAMGVTFGDIVLAVEHVKCAKEAQRMGRDRAQLILVREGEVTPPEEMALAAKHGFIERMHTGHEVTVGQWYLAKRADRLEGQLYDVLICLDKTSEFYRKNRKELQ
jgi:hypothetical protein